MGLSRLRSTRALLTGKTFLLSGQSLSDMFCTGVKKFSLLCCIAKPYLAVRLVEEQDDALMQIIFNMIWFPSKNGIILVCLALG